jgi:hypothetical protein
MQKATRGGRQKIHQREDIRLRIKQNHLLQYALGSGKPI